MMGQREKNDWKEWVKTLAVALKAWCDSQGYKPRVRLARELGIKQSSWEAIMSAKSVVGKVDPTVYARLFLRTGLAEADPRNLPPLARKLPTGEIHPEERAWPQSKYLGWLRKIAQGSSELSGYAQRLPALDLTELPKKPEKPDLPITLGSIVDVLVASLAQQVVERSGIETLVEQIAGLRQQVRSLCRLVATSHEVVAEGDIATVDKTANQLLVQLSPFLEADDPAQRDKLIRAIGPSLLGPLYYALGALTEEGSEREKAVERWRLSGELFGGNP